MVLTEAQQLDLVKAFSPDDVKQALLDIDDLKAPGPDIYSALFFKKAWPLVGEEVTEAILSFFRSGHLLREVNITVINLVAKMPNPSFMTDY